MAEIKESLSRQVALTISCTDVPSKDTFSKSDCIAILYEQSGNDWRYIGRTEWIKDNNNPSFNTRIEAKYWFEKEQNMRIKIYDVDDEKGIDSDFDGWLRRQEYIGYYDFKLARLVSSRNGLSSIMTKPSGELRSAAKVHLRADAIATENVVAFAEIVGRNWKKDSFFGKDDLALTISKKRPDGTLFPVYESPVARSTQDPIFPPCEIAWATLLGGQANGEIAIQGFWVKSGGKKRELMGVWTGMASEIIFNDGETRDPPTIYLHAPDNKTKLVATVEIKRMHIVRRTGFLDYVRAGLQLRMMFAVDFTASNGNPNTRGSLHYSSGPHDPTAYERAIRRIGNILVEYTEQPMIPAYGFGARIKVGNKSEVSHCFPLSLDESKHSFTNVEGVVAAYRAAIANSNVSLSGPTNFSELITTAAGFASEPYSPVHQHYTILVIITDGMISDMDETVASIVAASTHPMSIIIIGVGSADFSGMVRLDGDEERLRANGVEAKRDLVQFVELNKYKYDEMLASETLREIPEQVMDFMKIHQILPVDPNVYAAYAAQAAQAAAAAAAGATPVTNP